MIYIGNTAKAWTKNINLVPELSDEKIMLLVKEGHLSDLAELFERYHVRLFNFFLRLTLDRAASEDLTQNLFYRVIKYRQSYQPGGASFQSWIYRMARNVHIDYCKQIRKMPDRPSSREPHGEGHEDGYGHDLSISEQVYTEDDYQRLDMAMARLDAGQREILVMSRFQGLKYEDIAKIMDISVPAIKVQVHRAIKRLRSLYFK